jgi:exopolysaccharide biosynthesis polyprenyl glycosylphosphotransferase
LEAPLSPERRGFVPRLHKLALPLACFVSAAVVVALTDDAGVSAIAVAAILTVAFVAGLELVRRSAWVSPLALGVPISAALGILLAVPAIALLDFGIPDLNVSGLQLALVGSSTFALWSFYWTWPRTRSRQARQRVLIVGRHGGGVALAEELARNTDLPFTCVGIVDEFPENEPGVADILDIKSTVLRERVDIVVFADSRYRDAAMPLLLDAAGLNLRVVGLADFYEHAFGRVPVEYLSETWFMSLLYLYRGRYPLVFKRSLDLMVASFALLVTAPLFPLIALLIALETRGPVFFRQVRVGEAGALFQIVKFRTMVNGAEDPGRAIWAQKDDKRATRVGKILRKTRLDELPQLWTVLRGEMSLIGPRPERPEFLEMLESMVPYWSRRHLVKPGITGWAQVRCGYTSDASSALEKLSYDLYYIKHRSPMLDFAVAAKTAAVMVSGSGAK